MGMLSHMFRADHPTPKCLSKFSERVRCNAEVAPVPSPRRSRHDCCEPTGYLSWNKTGGRIIFNHYELTWAVPIQIRRAATSILTPSAYSGSSPHKLKPYAVTPKQTWKYTSWSSEKSYAEWCTEICIPVWLKPTFKHHSYLFKHAWKSGCHALKQDILNRTLSPDMFFQFSFGNRIHKTNMQKQL